MTTEQIRIRVDREQMADLKKTAAACGLDYQTTASILLIAAIRAVSEAGNQLPLPLKLELTPQPVSKTDTQNKIVDIVRKRVDQAKAARTQPK